jgi:Anti-sigma-K factor rskA
VSVSHEPFDTLAALHAVGALDGDDLREFEAHLAAGCARCATVVRQTEQALARAAMAGPPEPPPAAVRDALVRRAATAGAPGRARRLPWVVGLAAAAVAAGALSAAYVASRYEARLGQMARETSAARERLARSEAELREEVESYRAAVDLLRDPATRVVELRGQAGAASAVARVLLTDKMGGVLLATNLPPVSPGRAYALWTLEGDVARPAGLFVPDSGGRAMLKVAAPTAAAPVRVLAVTLEPESGVTKPTGPVVLAPR